MNNTTSTPNPTNRTLPAAILVVVIAGLYFARDVLIPIALAILLSFLLSPLVNRLQRTGLKRVPASLIVVFVSFCVFGLAGWVVFHQLIAVAGELPQYRQNIHKKVASLRLPSHGSIGRATQSLKDISKEIVNATQTTSETAEGETSDTSKAETTGALAKESSQTRASSPTKLLAGSAGASSKKQGDNGLAGPGDPKPTLSSLTENAQSKEQKKNPIPVTLVDAPASSVKFLGEIIGPALAPIGTGLIVIVFCIFMLIQREDLRDRFIRLVGSGRLQVTTKAMDDAAQRVSRYLVMQATVNTIYGFCFGTALYFIGVPNAFLWGILAAIMRFVPYIGTWIAAAMPIALSLAVFDGWTRPLITVIAFLGIDLTVANVVEPLLYGSKTGLSSLAVLVSAVFWAWLWGPIGLMLSTPMTVCLVVIGRYAPQLAFLNILLSDEEVLPPPMRLYQRLLAMDYEESEKIVEVFAKENSVEKAYDEVLIPALCSSEEDRHRGRMDEAHQRFVRQTCEELIEALQTVRETEEKEGPDSPLDKDQDGAAVIAPVPVPRSTDRGLCVLTIPAHDEADEMAARMLTQLLAFEGHCSEFLSAELLASEMLDAVGSKHAELICVSAVPPFATTHARYLCKRLKARFPDLTIIVGLWNAIGDLQRARGRMPLADKVVATLAEAKEAIRQMETAIVLARGERKAKAG